MNSDKATTGQATVDDRRWDKGQRVVGAERQTLAKDLVEQYADGASIRALATSIGRSYGFVHRVLTESGAPLRARGGVRGRSRHTGQQ